MCLKDKVMLINLSISQWSARKYDKSASQEVETSHGAHDAGRYNKILINDASLKAITTIAGKARTFHYFNTLPWSDSGDRVLPTANYFPYISEMGKIKEEFNAAVRAFLSEYDLLVLNAKSRLASMFNEADYPTHSMIEDKFSINFSVMPISDAEDFRVDLSKDEVDRIKVQIQGEVQNRVDVAVSDMINRIKETLAHMVSKLSDPEAIFRDSLVTNICNLTEVLPRLNFKNDTKITQMCIDLKPLCCDIDRLRTDPQFRTEMKDKAFSILQSL